MSYSPAPKKRPAKLGFIAQIIAAITAPQGPLAPPAFQGARIHNAAAMPRGGKGVAKARRAARKRQNIRARSSKRKF